MSQPCQLLLDFSSSLLIAVFSRTGELLAGRVERPGSRGDRALATVEALLRDSDCRFSDLTALLVGTGPGSFTGLRVALAMAEGLAFDRNLPRHPFGSLRGFLEGSREREGDSAAGEADPSVPGSLGTSANRRLALLPANSGSFYALKSWQGGEFICPAEKVPALLAESDTVITAGPMPKQAVILASHPDLRHFEEEVDFIRLRRLALAAPAAAEGRLKPLYLLASAAEVKAGGAGNASD